MSATRPAIALAVGACTALATSSIACRATKPSPAPSAARTGPDRAAAVVPTSPEALLAFVRVREDAVSALRARFTVEFQADPRHRRQLDGVVVVRKPDAFRMSLVSPFGLTVFDHVARAGSARTRYPMGEPGRGPDASLSHEQMAQAFLRGEHAFPGRCEARAVTTDTVEFRCADAGRDHHRRLTVERASGNILLERSFTAGREQLRIERGDYRRAGGSGPRQRHLDVELPWRIKMTTPGTDRIVEIGIRTYEIDPDLAEDLFMFDPQ